MQTVGSNRQEMPLPLHNRRRRVRQKAHSPAYASLNGSASGHVLELSEIVNISEGGMAIQAASPLQVQHSLDVCLDLTATSARILTTGEVVWTNPSGRAGIRFPQMPDDSLRQLKEWLFLNAMLAGVNQQFPAEEPQIVREVLQRPVQESALVNWMRHEVEPTAPADYTSILTALAAVKREVDSLGCNLEGALQLLAERALTFTRATGAAIALTEGANMICRARAGDDAPGVGMRFATGSGFSGECVRTGRLLTCEDSETDPLVDRESCRQLGIRSMVAVPIKWEEAVIGLLEVFSPEPYAFGINDPIVLKRLAAMCSSAVHRAGQPEVRLEPQGTSEQDSPDVATDVGVPAPVASSVDDEFPVETVADLPLPGFSRSRKILLAAAAATVLFVGSWLFSPSDFLVRRSTSAPSATVQAAPKPLVQPVQATNDLQGMRKLAEQGDPAAQFSVGARYATGEDVPQDYAEAVRWFSMAAEQGHVVSQATLGAYYWAGRGVPQDLVKAYFWSVLAQAGGDEASKYRVAVLASRMTHTQITAAQQLANDWIKEHQSVSQNSAPPQ